MHVTAAVADKPREPFSIETLELDEPRDDEVLVRVMAAGALICWRETRTYPFRCRRF